MYGLPCGHLQWFAHHRYHPLHQHAHGFTGSGAAVERRATPMLQRSAMQALSCMRIGRCQGFKVKQRNHVLMSQSGARGVPGLLRVRLMKFFFKETEHWP